MSFLPVGWRLPDHSPGHSMETACKFFLVSALIASIAFAREYELGKLYQYAYSTSVQLSEPQPARGTDVGFAINASVTLTPVWADPEDYRTKFFKMQLQGPQLLIKSRRAPSPEGFVEHSSCLNQESKTTLYFLRNNGIITNVFVPEGDLPVVSNIKKGIASLFQYQPGTHNAIEVDSSGICQASYRDLDGYHLEKVKSGCRPSDEAHHLFRNNKVLTPELESRQRATLTLDKHRMHIQKAESEETVLARLTNLKEVAGSITVRQHLHLKRTHVSRELLSGSWNEILKQASDNEGRPLVVKNLVSEEEMPRCWADCKNVEAVVKEEKENLSPSSLATLRNIKAFLKLLTEFRNADQPTLTKLLKDHRRKSYFPQLLDVLAAAQTISAHEAAMGAVWPKAAELHLVERYLLGVSLSSHPSEYLIRDLLKRCQALKAPGEKLEQTLLLTLASVTKTFVVNAAAGGAGREGQEAQIVRDVSSFFLSSLGQCGDHDIDCRVVYLRALKNLPREEHVGVLVRYAQVSDRKVTLAALETLHAYPGELLDDGSRSVLSKIFHQLRQRHDPVTRALAADILIRERPSSALIRQILESFSSPGGGSRDLNQFVLQRIRDRCVCDASLKEALETVLSDPRLHNYGVLAQRGLSTSFTRTLYSHPDNGNCTFTTAMQTAGAMLKRSTFDLDVRSDDASLRLLSNFFPSGGGGDPEDEETDQPATAGMEFALLGSQLRPFVFFSGRGELMGHVMSGTASDRTTALQATVLLHDHSEPILLHNGFAARLILLGAASFDFSGQVQVSLWNRNSHSLVENRAALVAQGVLQIDTSAVRSLVQFSAATETQIDFVSDLNFYDKIALCLRMSQPSFTVRHNVRKIEEIPEKLHSLRRIVLRKYTVPGRTYVLNQKNSQICSEMFPPS